MTGAAAIWVKTPGLSPVKTRLAEAVGRGAAERFHRLAAEAVRAVVRSAAATAPLTPYWAVAEAGSGGWTGEAVVEQGEGRLGERLARVYDELLARHRFVLFLGADSPQLTPALVAEAARRAEAGAWVLGPADDGGFYLFAGSRPLPRDAWTRVPYSDPRTLAALEAQLAPRGPVSRLPTLFDVDTAAELSRLRAQLAAARDLLPEQRALADWLRALRSDGLVGADPGGEGA